MSHSYTSRQNRGSSSRGLTKEVDIPDHVPVGMVIGKGGRFQKALKQKHDVRFYVKIDERKVILSGSLNKMDDAADELAQLFARAAISAPSQQQKKRVFECSAQAGSKYCWKFVETKPPESDTNVETFVHILQHAGPADEIDDLETAWIQEFDVRKMMKTVQTPDTSYKLVVSFGNCYFKLYDLDDVPESMEWIDLQRLKRGSHFSTRWSNIFNRENSEKIKALITDLEAKADESKDVITVHVTNRSTNESCHMKYHLIEGNVSLKYCKTRRQVLCTSDVFLNNTVSFRVRAVSHDPTPDVDIMEFVKSHVTVSKPQDGDVFDVKATLSDEAHKQGLVINRVNMRKRVHVLYHDLYFTLAYTNRAKTECRIDIRLPPETAQILSLQEGCRMLVKEIMDKALQV